MYRVYRWAAGSLAVAALSVGTVWWGTSFHSAVAASLNVQDQVMFAQTLVNAPRLKLTSVLISFAPGEKKRPHHHAGSVYEYVLSGSIRSQVSATGPIRVYGKGESFFEPAGSLHMISENASATSAAQVLAVVVADQTAMMLTSPE